MALISWKQISPDLLSYGRLTGSLEVSGSIVSEGHIVPSTGAEFDLGSADKPFRDLYLHTASLKFVREGAVISTIVGDADGIKIGNIRITTSIFSKTGSFSSATTDIQVTGSLSIRLNGSSDTFKVNINGEDKLEVNTEGTVIYKPIATAPTYVSGGLFFSASGDFYLGG